MFCSLCRAEYREGFTRCADCGLELVASLELSEVQQDPPKLLWTGRDEKLFDLLLTALRDAGIPCAAKRPPRTFLARRLLPKAEISVRSSNLETARRVAAAAAQNPNFFEMHRDLVCPLCGAEFDKDSAECSECGVALISWDEAQEPIDPELASEPLEVIWQGSDPFAVSKVVAELRDEGIVHQVQATHDHFVYELAMPRPRYHVTVFRSDSEKAWNRIATIPQGYVFSRRTPGQRLLDAEASLVDPGAAPWPARLKKWKPKEATLEIWSGQDTAFAHMISSCFAENDLRCRLQDESPGLMRVFVRPSDATRAREILREITEGTPPD